MQKRNPYLVLFLIFATMTFYVYYYAYKTTFELNQKVGGDLRPELDLLFILMGCTPYALYIPYRNQKVIDDWYRVRDGNHKPRSTLLAGLCVIPAGLAMFGMVSVFVLVETTGAMWGMWFFFASYLLSLVSWSTAVVIYQKEQNRFADETDATLSLPVFE